MNIQDQSSSETGISSDAQPSGNAPSSALDSAVSQWKVLLILAAGVLLISVSFNFLLLKQNRMLIAQRQQQTELLQRVEQLKIMFHPLLQDVGHFSVQYPEVRGILTKYGIRVDTSPQSAIPSP